MSASPVLVADPDPLQRQLLDMLLDVDAFELTVVSNGQEALAHLRHNTPDAVVLAVDLSDVAGSVVCRKLKSVRRLAHVPVVLLADEPERGALLSEQLRREAREAGVDLLLQKPLGDKNLRERLQRLIQDPPPAVDRRALLTSHGLGEPLGEPLGVDDGPSGTDAPAPPNNDVGALRAEVTRLQQENESLKTRLAKVKDRAAALQAELEELRKPRGLFGRRG